MVGKRVQFDDGTWAVVNLLRQERLRESTGLPPLKRKPRPKASATRQ
jgi:hypothetical protein